MNLPQSVKQLYYEQVWALVKKVPTGRVTTYGQIAAMLPVLKGISADDYKTYASRWVGMAMASSPDDVPWQRVINSQGKVSPRAEAAKQKQLLEEEGVLFKNDRLDLKHYQWHGPGKSDTPKQDQLF